MCIIIDDVTVLGSEEWVTCATLEQVIVISEDFPVYKALHQIEQRSPPPVKLTNKLLTL